jgi:hypothetical protein
LAILKILSPVVEIDWEKKGRCAMNVRISTTGFLVVAVLAGGWFGANAWKSAGAAGAPPPASITTFSTANIGRQGHFYVGGKWVGAPGKDRSWSHRLPRRHRA